MKNLIQNLTQIVPNKEYDSFKDYIAISSDTLLIINKQLELVEWIIEGNDTNGIYLAADTEDDFLDALSLFKHLILTGNNPKTYINFK